MTRMSRFYDVLTELKLYTDHKKTEATTATVHLNVKPWLDHYATPARASFTNGLPRMFTHSYKSNGPDFHRSSRKYISVSLKRYL